MRLLSFLSQFFIYGSLLILLPYTSHTQFLYICTELKLTTKRSNSEKSNLERSNLKSSKWNFASEGRNNRMSSYNGVQMVWHSIFDLFQQLFFDLSQLLFDLPAFNVVSTDPEIYLNGEKCDKNCECREVSPQWHATLPPKKLQ